MPAAAGRRAVQARAQAATRRRRAGTASVTPPTPNEAEVLLYDVIGGWFGIYADEFLAELRQVTAPKMRVRINSPGGSVFEGIAIANALRAHPATVAVQVDGIAASIASVIAMAGDRIEMAPNSMLMIHEASGACMGPASEMTKMAEVLDLISTNISNAYADRTGTDAGAWRDAMKAETWYLPDDAVAAGLADAALSAVPESPNAPEEPEEDDAEELAEELAEARMRARFDLAAYGYQGPPQPEHPSRRRPPHASRRRSRWHSTINIGDALGADTVVAQAARRGHPDASAEPVGTGPGEDEAAGADAASPEAPEPAATQPPTEGTSDALDEWAQHIARLTPPPDPWAADIARLTSPASSSATES
jgi:ATP-dependent protease ClpP protease subunit